MMYFCINFSDVITPLLVIIGWLVVHHQTKERERQAEWRSLAKILAKNIESIELLSIKYHMNRTRDFELEEKILLKIDRLEGKCNTLSKNIGFDTKFITDFKKSVTEINFQSKDHHSEKFDSNIIKQISLSANMAIDALYSVR